MWTSLRAGVVVALMAAQPVGVQGSRQASDLERWLDAVERHQPGRNDASLAEIDRWSRADLMTGVLSRVRGAVREPARSAVLKRGAMLHTDIAMLRVTSGQFAAMTSPGTPLRAPYQVHLDIARQLVGWVEPDPRTDPDVRAWYDAVTAWLHRDYLVTELHVHLDRARELYPDDAATALHSGTAAEALAAAAAQNTVTRQVVTPATRVVIRSPETHLREAERYFRRALDRDPGLVEAHLRLGRTLDALGRREAALEHLDRVRTGPAEPVQLYFAHISAGRVLEDRDGPRAVEAYEQASALFPRAQSPLLSLARLAGAQGDATAARGLVDRVLALPWRDREREDPWWIYHEGVGRHVGALLDRLRARIAALPRSASWQGTPPGIAAGARR